MPVIQPHYNKETLKLLHNTLLISPQAVKCLKFSPTQKKVLLNLKSYVYCFMMALTFIWQFYVIFTLLEQYRSIN